MSFKTPQPTINTMKRAIGQYTPQRPGNIQWDRAWESARAAGFDGLECCLDDWWPDATNSHSQQSDKQITAASPGRIPLLAASVRCNTTDHDVAVEWLTNHMQQASAIGVSTLNVTLPGMTRLKDSSGFARYQDAINFTHNLARTLRYEAESHGVTMAVEPCTSSFLLSPVELRELVDLANSHAIGVCLDLTRIARIGNPIDWIITLNRRIACLRIRRPRAVTDDEPGLHLAEIRRALDECRYSGPVIIDGDAVPEPFR